MDNYMVIHVCIKMLEKLMDNYMAIRVYIK
jgi:hypothetical protein